MNLLLTPSNTALGRALRWPLRLIPRNFVVRVIGGVTKGMKWRVGSTVHGCWLGTYEVGKQSAVRDLVKPGMNVLDIGANAGYYMLAFSTLCGPSGHVWAFEPLAENVNNLLHHAKINALRNATVVQAAVSDRIGVAGFHIAPDNSMGTLSAGALDYLVPTVTLDSLVESGKIPAPDVVKMDIEGGETCALLGARNLLALRKATWLIALHGEKQRTDCLALLSAVGYSIRELSTDEIIATPA